MRLKLKREEPLSNLAFQLQTVPLQPGDLGWGVMLMCNPSNDGAGRGCCGTHMTNSIGFWNQALRQTQDEGPLTLFVVSVLL